MLRSAGWNVRLVGTPEARPWIGHRTVAAPDVRFEFRPPEHQRWTGDPDVVVICPATFNTINKIAVGIADNYATSLICEAIGMKVPLVVVPMINNKLWGHPALSASVATLTASGARFLDLHTGEPGLSPVRSGSGDSVVADFHPSWLSTAIQSFR
jgi:phosphopantothenoylcysteine synthetase/decarboxylase